MNNNQKTKDYITLWNTGVSFIYFALGIYEIMQIILFMQTAAQLKSLYASSGITSSSYSMSIDTVISLVFAVVMFVAGVTNLFYTRKYFRDDNPKSSLGYIATISLAASNIYVLIELILFVTHAFASNRLIISSLMSSYSWILWMIIGVVAFNAVAAVLGFVNMMKWSPMTIDEEVGGTAAAPEGIAADVATHAMGHEAPSAEMAATEVAKKDLPPMLSAEPEEPVVNHGVVGGSPVVPEAASAMPGGEANQATTAVTSPEPPQQPEQPTDPMANFGKL